MHKPNKLNELIAKKKAKGDVLDPMEASAKSSVLKNLMSDMGDLDSAKLGKVQKVTVAAPDKKGLEEGLEKAKEIVEEKDSSDSYAGMEDKAEEELEEDESLEDLSPEELEEKIAEMQALLKNKKSSSMMA